MEGMHKGITHMLKLSLNYRHSTKVSYMHKGNHSPIAIYYDHLKKIILYNCCKVYQNANTCKDCYFKRDLVEGLHVKYEYIQHDKILERGECNFIDPSTLQKT